jgi:hypothetical protein
MSTADKSHPLFRAGDTVYTLYGAGVIVSTEPISNSVEFVDTVTGHDRAVEPPTSNSELWYTVRLWRLPNRSVGSSALATLRSSAVCLACPRTNSRTLVVVRVYPQLTI